MSLDPVATWIPLACGVGAFILGSALRGRETWLSPGLLRVCGLPLSDREARWLPRLLWTGGAAWLAIFLFEIIPFPHDQRPYPVLLLGAPLLFLAPLTTSLAILWLFILRRFAR